MIDLDDIERKAQAFRDFKARATNGKWLIGEWEGRCTKHEFGKHPGLHDAKAPCEITMVLNADGDQSAHISTSDYILIVGSNEEGPILSPHDAEFIVHARNSDLDGDILSLVAELRALRPTLNNS